MRSFHSFGCKYATWPETKFESEDGCLEKQFPQGSRLVCGIENRAKGRESFSMPPNSRTADKESLQAIVKIQGI
jgi:hypothetical protein